MGFQNASENVPHSFENLVIWLWKSFEVFLKVFIQILVSTLAYPANCSLLKSQLQTALYVR